MRLTILLSTAPESGDLEIVKGLIQSGLKKGLSIYLYLVDEGVRCIRDKSLMEMAEKGLKLYVCAYGAQKRGISPSNVATFGGLAVLSELIKNCDRFIGF